MITEEKHGWNGLCNHGINRQSGLCVNCPPYKNMNRENDDDDNRCESCGNDRWTGHKMNCSELLVNAGDHE